MRVLIVSCVFPPEPVTSALTSEHLAVGLVERGHEVTVIAAFPNRPGGKVYAGYRRVWRTVETTEKGYKLIRTFATLSPKPTVVGRFLENLSFGITSAINALPVKPDVVYANTWPIFATGLVSAVCAAKNLPLVINVQDIYPDAAIELGKLPNSGIVPDLLKGLDSMIARNADLLVTLSENFAEFYSSTRKVPREKIKVVYNWMDEEEIKPGSRMGKFRKLQGISEDSFVVMYSGNVGVNAGVEFVIEAARKLEDLKKVVFVIAGDGSCRGNCEALVEGYGLSNVQFFYPLPKEYFSDVQASADLMLLPTRKSGALTSVPSKLVAYMLSGRAVLAGVAEQSDTARIIREAECGICIPPEDPESMAQEIRKLIEMPENLSLMDTRARNYAEQKFSRKACVPQLINVLESVVKC